MSLPVPPLRRQWDDGTMDAIAAVECQLAGDDLGLRAVLANADPASLAASALKLLFELAAERGCCPCHFRPWALEAIGRA